ncbi:protein spaetzle isoform X9 [Drosophila takahashii]|uniref:protein spaetzle isoform X9 n=1 Tax=Drosophila takahashii TaxID=29030 RepID=UPI001CF8257B|nr:protein spaetzle isoform X6 [Drosophila takahashii]
MMMMTPMWIALLKVLVLLISLFTAYEAKDYDGVIRELFTVTNETGVVLFNESNTEVQSDQANHPPRRPMDSFVFPDSPLVANRSQQSLVNGTNEPCSNSKDSSKTFCTEVDDYPDLSKLKAKLDKFAKFFVSDFLPTDVSSRVGDYDKEEKFLCKSTRRLMYPKKGQKTDKTWQLIVNNDEFKQGIQIEECDGDGVPCEYAKNFPNNYQPICKQHYMQQTLASIENEGELDVVQQTFLIPSCCKCAIRVIN